jgi:hypothetical protein
MPTYSYKSNAPAVADVIEGILFSSGVLVNYSTDQLNLNKYVPTRLDRFVDGVLSNTDLVIPANVTNQERYESQSETGLRYLGQGLDIAGSRTVTGTTVETSVYQLLVPANSMSAVGSLRITYMWNMTNNANTKTLRVKFGNSAPMTLTAATNSIAAMAGLSIIQNMGSTNIQEAFASLAVSIGSTGTAVVTGAFNTGVDQLLEITLQLGVGTDTTSLRRVLVELINP